MGFGPPGRVVLDPHPPMRLLLLFQRLYAYLFIAFHGVRGFLERGLRPQREGLEGFVTSFVHEGLPPVPARHRDVYDTFVRCTGCGACDALCPLFATADPLAWRGPMALVISMARAAPHYGECVGALDCMGECATCRACERTCPQRIPILQVGQMMQDALAEIARSRRT